MQITIKFGSSDFSINNIVIESVEDKTTVADILIQLREQMSPWHIAIMERGIEGLDGKDGVDSVVGGLESLPVKSHLFLAAEINGELEKLEADKRIGEYNLGEKPILQLMCSAIDPNAIK